MWAIAVKPFATLLLFAAVIIPIELTIRRFFPDGAIKDLLFDRTFRDRHPGLFMVWWVILVVGVWAWIYINFMAGPH
jgi:hypothetical protein